MRSVWMALLIVLGMAGTGWAAQQPGNPASYGEQRLPGAAPNGGDLYTLESTTTPDYARWTLRVGVAHESTGRTISGNPQTTGIGGQVQYNFSPNWFLQGTMIVQVGGVWSNQPLNFMIFTGYEWKP